MATYTMQLREYIESFSQYESLSIRDKIEKGRTKLFDFDYPLFDSDYKKVFETRFIRRFYMREIGFETEGLFKFQLENWLIINMPYFNKLFESELIVFNPLDNTHGETKHTKTLDKDQTQNSTTTGTNESNVNQTNNGTLSENNFERHLKSDNPDSRLSLTPNEDGSGVIQYAKEIDENKENNSKTSESTGTTTTNDTTNVTSNGTANINELEDFIATKTGKIGVQSYSKMLNEYRESFLRIENKIFNEMQELFMLVY